MGRCVCGKRIESRNRMTDRAILNAVLAFQSASLLDIGSGPRAEEDTQDILFQFGQLPLLITL